MSTETVRILVLVAIPVLATGAWLVADIIAVEKELRHDRQAFDAHVAELAERRAARDAGNRDHGRA